MNTVWNGRKNHIQLSASAYPGEEKLPQLWKMICGAGFFCQASTFDSELRLEKNSFLTERCGNVIENKGPLWKTWEQSWNLHENTGS